MHYIIYRIILEHGRIPVFVICFIEIKTGLFSFITTCNLIFQLQEIIPFDKNEDNVLLMYEEPVQSHLIAENFRVNVSYQMHKR